MKSPEQLRAECAENLQESLSRFQETERQLSTAAPALGGADRADATRDYLEARREHQKAIAAAEDAFGLSST